MADPEPAGPHRLQRVTRVPLWSRRSAGFPAVLPPLVGRQRDIAALLDLLRQPDSRLITLTGPAGIGKTRFALAVTGEIEPEFAGGAAFVPLASVTDPALVLPAIARALDVRESSERPLLHALAEAMRDRPMLLVLDNVEHLLPAAAQVSHLLAECPQLKVLATSRAPLRLSVEQRVETPPLTLPASGDTAPLPVLAGYEAVALFVERARAVKRDFALDAGNAAAVTEICRRLDGLPLAIELAAAWIRVLPPGALLARLAQRLSLLHGGAEDQPVRLRTMRDAIAWSYDLLSPDEARLFRRLGIFVGGCTLEAAEDVGGVGGKGGRGEDRWAPSSPGAWSTLEGSVLPPFPPTPLPPSVLDLLAALIDKSLVQAAHADEREPRYQMLETVREFALERLTASGEAAAMATAHAAAMLSFAERVEPVLLGPDELVWHARVDVEMGNLRAALAWALQHDIETALRIGAALWVHWSWYRLPEGRRWLTAALERPEGTSALIQSRALTTDAALAALEGNFAASLERSRAAVSLAQEAGDALAEARARWVVACAWNYTNRLEEGLLEQQYALRLFARATTSTDRAWAAFAHANHAGVIAWLGDHGRGIALYEDALGEARAVGSDGITVAILGDLAGWLIGVGETPSSAGGGSGGEWVRARELLQEALALAADRSGRWLAIYPLLSLALVDALEGDAASAARRLGASAAMTALAGLEPPTHYQERLDRATALARDALGAEAFAALWEAGWADPTLVLAGASGPGDGAGSAGRNDAAARYGLTVRQRDVLRLLADGRTDKEIAAMLYVTRRTASKHVSAILARLGVASRGAAVGVALRRDLL